jgi:solute carrier family 45 protein 1/2/4
MIPPIADSDPDPTTQIPWPARGQVDQPLETSVVGESAGAVGENGDHKSPKTTSVKRLTQWELITLSIAMGGAQIAWTVELG